MLALGLSRSALAAVGIDWLSPAVRRLYRQEELGVTLEAPAPRTAVTGRPADYDVLVVGGGPAGSSAATFLSRGGLRVAVVEREAFPRFHVGESLLPANLPVLERLGVLDEVKARGFQVKYGAYFHDQEIDLGYQFFFREGKPWPPYTYEVQRGEFDKILLDHAARQPNVTLLQPASVERVAFDDEGVTVTLADAAGPREVRARFLVDASGRDGFIASRHGRRRPIEGLGKVALFAHFRGGRRWPGKEEGNIRIYIFEAGWFWYIPFANGTSSVGCVLHARTVRGREGDLEELYESLIARCHGLVEALEGAPRITPVHRAANFSYRTDPAIGDRFLCVGDAIAFVDPIFSSGVFIAIQSAELAAKEILKAFRENRFEARRFRGYERRIRTGMKPFQRFIRQFYDPSFVEMFLKPREFAGMVDSVTGVLAGGAFLRRSLRMRISLELFFTIVRINRWVRRRRGLSRNPASNGSAPAAPPAGLPLHGARDRGRRGRAGRAGRHGRAHHALHRRRRPLRAGPDLGGRRGHGHGHRLHRGRPPAARPRSTQIGRVPGRGRGAGAGDAAAQPHHVAVPDPHPGADPGAWIRRCACPIATTASSRCATGASFGRAIAGWRWSAPTSRPRAGSRRAGRSTWRRGRTFQVVGVLDKTLTAPDRFAIVPLDDARDLWLRRDPLLVQVFAGGAGGLGRGDLNTGAAVAWADGVDPDALARRIQAEVPGVNVHHPGRAEPPAAHSPPRSSPRCSSGSASLGLVIGGLSLANTVTAAVFERIRDFGVKRALGATDGQLLREVLGEALGVSASRAALLGVGLALAVGALVDARGGRPAALPVLAAPARLLARLLDHAGRARRDLRHPPDRPAVARRGDPARGLKGRRSGRPRARAHQDVPRPRRPAGPACSTAWTSRSKPAELVAVVGPVRLREVHPAQPARPARAADAGEIWLDDVRVSALSRRAQCRVRGRSIGYVFQSFLLIAGLTALENVLLAARYVGRAAADGAGARRAALMDRLGVAHRADHYPAQLSGGEQQRVAYCRAVLNAPPLVLADEPTGNLDEGHAARDPGRAARALPGARRPSVILVTHRADAAARADRALHLRAGRLESQGGDGHS